ncbi:MAG: hypothetical protein ACTSQN_06085 [Candidatus Heimdallarchaeota archaeon]
MMAQNEVQQERLIQEVWGRFCLDCDCKTQPKIHKYWLKNEEVTVLCCSKCYFTIVVVEVDKLSSPDLKDTFQEDDSKTIIATHNMH